MSVPLPLQVKVDNTQAETFAKERRAKSEQGLGSPKQGFSDFAPFCSILLTTSPCEMYMGFNLL